MDKNIKFSLKKDTPEGLIKSMFSIDFLHECVHSVPIFKYDIVKKQGTMQIIFEDKIGSNVSKQLLLLGNKEFTITFKKYLLTGEVIENLYITARIEKINFGNFSYYTDFDIANLIKVKLSIQSITEGNF